MSYGGMRSNLLGRQTLGRVPRDRVDGGRAVRWRGADYVVHATGKQHFGAMRATVQQTGRIANDCNDLPSSGKRDPNARIELARTEHVQIYN
jgi:hypothetical protein